MRDAANALDHLLIGAATIESGIAWLEERTGVRAVQGGSHPGLGTWNALASLGPRQYVEIIAPDPGQPGVETFYVPGLRGFLAPRIATWVAGAVDLTTRFGSALPSGFSCAPVRQGARIRPDGTRLAWTLAFPQQAVRGTFDGALPFFIEWESPAHHPGQSTPKGLSLLSLSFEHPEPAALGAALQSLDLRGDIAGASEPRIVATLATPLGVVTL
jgi:hypothetical protein